MDPIIHVIDLGEASISAETNQSEESSDDGSRDGDVAMDVKQYLP